MTIRTSSICLGVALTAFSVMSGGSFAMAAGKAAAAVDKTPAIVLAQLNTPGPGGTAPSAPAGPGPGIGVPRSPQQPRTYTPRTYTPRGQVWRHHVPQLNSPGFRHHHYYRHGYPYYVVPNDDYYYDQPNDDRCTYWHARCSRAFGYPTRRYYRCMVRHSCEPL